MKYLIYLIAIVGIGLKPLDTLGQMTLLDAKEYALKNHYNIANSILEYDKAIHQKKEYLEVFIINYLHLNKLNLFQ